MIRVEAEELLLHYDEKEPALIHGICSRCAKRRRRKLSSLEGSKKQLRGQRLACALDIFLDNKQLPISRNCGELA